MALDRGLWLSEQGDASRLLLWIAHAFSRNDVEVESAVRASLSAWQEQVGPLMAARTDRALISKPRIVALSPDGKTALTEGITQRDETAQLWKTSDGTPIGQPMRHRDQVWGAAFSPDGKTVVTGSWDKTARLWNATDGTPIGQPMRHEGQVCAVAFSPDGKTVLTGSWDKTARLWNATDGTPIGQPMGHRDQVWAAAFSPDGKIIATGSWDKTARLWSASDGTPIGRPMRHQAPVRSVAFMADGKNILTWTAASGDNVTRFWSVPSSRDGDARLLGTLR